MKKWHSLLIVFFAFSITSATACSCVQSKASLSKKVKAAYTSSDAVFTGKIISKTIAQNNPGVQSSSDIVTYIVAVVTSFKDISEETIEVKSYRDGAFCGFEFEINKTYLIYARNHDSALFTDLCTRTKRMKNIEKKELRILGRQHCQYQSKNNSHG